MMEGKNNPMFGKRHTKEARIKMKNAAHKRKLKGAWNSEETKRKMREAHKGRKGYWAGKKRPDETNEKISKALKGRARSEKNIEAVRKALKGKHRSEGTRQLIREGVIKYLASGKHKFKTTKIELKMEKELKKRNIYYQKNVPLCKIAIVDFYLPQGRTVIQCDGEWWHSSKKAKQRDRNQDFILTFFGFNVYRFTEAEINRSVEECVSSVLGGENQWPNQ